MELLKWRAELGASEEAGPERVTSSRVEGPWERWGLGAPGELGFRRDAESGRDEVGGESP